MLWKNQRASSNVDDRRGLSPGGMVGGGLGLVVVVIALLMGADPRQLLQQMSTGSQQPGASQGAVPADPHQEELKQFVSVVLADTEDVWTAQMKAQGKTYDPPTLVLFSGSVDSACGQASAAVGPFYCPQDQNVYLDLSFLDDLGNKLGAQGDFAQAYVIAHEVGHHIQKELGIMDKVDAERSQSNATGAESLSVRLELQADFFAGVWAHYAQQTKGILEPGDIEEALNAASQIGDDRLQQEGQGYVVPDSFTHGTSAQRVRWFKKGYESGDISQGDTFSARSL